MIPTTILNGMVSGVVGTLSHYGPMRARTGVLDTAEEANNVFGRAFTFNDDAVESFQAGGAGQFAGILIHPHAYQMEGAFVANGTPAELLDMGEIFVEIEGVVDAEIGDPVYYVVTTGVLTLTATGNTAVPNCRLERHLPSAETPNLAVVRLTN